MSNEKKNQAINRGAVGGIAALLAAPINAAMLEEVVVTAQKREQSLQDVPISVAVMSGEKLENYSMNGLEELSASMPNIHIKQTKPNYFRNKNTACSASKFAAARLVCLSPLKNHCPSCCNFPSRTSARKSSIVT